VRLIWFFCWDVSFAATRTAPLPSSSVHSHSPSACSTLLLNIIRLPLRLQCDDHLDTRTRTNNSNIQWPCSTLSSTTTTAPSKHNHKHNLHPPQMVHPQPSLRSRNTQCRRRAAMDTSHKRHRRVASNHLTKLSPANQSRALA
jgi:hypothetical protein